MKTKMSDWKLEYRKKGSDGKGWYWHYETDTDVWDYGSYGDKQVAIDDWEDMVKHRGFEVR